MIKVILNNNGFNFNEGITVNEIIKKLNLNYKNIKRQSIKHPFANNF